MFIAFPVIVLLSSISNATPASCSHRIIREVCASGATALCRESEVYTPTNDEAKELVSQSNMMGHDDVKKWSQFLSDSRNFMLLYRHEVGTYGAFGKLENCRLLKVEQISD